MSFHPIGQLMDAACKRMQLVKFKLLLHALLRLISAEKHYKNMKESLKNEKNISIIRC